MREWELSYRLGMRKDKNKKRLVSNACPEKSDKFSMLDEILCLIAKSTDSPEPNELQEKRRRKEKDFALPSSFKFYLKLQVRNSIISMRLLNSTDNF